MPITYLSGGMLGDFIQQLSIVYEKFLETNEKAIIYIGNYDGHSFRFSLEQTFTDLLPIVSNQSYILDFKIYNNEQFDIDLSNWIHHLPSVNDEKYEGSFVPLISDMYGVKWGSHKWIHNIPVDEKWTDIVVVNTVEYRFPHKVDWDRLVNEYGKDNITFIGFDEKQYEFFTNKCFEVEYYKPKTLFEMFVIINSCKLFVGSTSAPLSMAMSLHKCAIIGFTTNKCIFRNLENYVPTLTGWLV